MSAVAAGWWLEDHYLGAYGEVFVVVAGVGCREVDAAVGRVRQAAAVKGYAAGGEEDRPGHGLVVDVADEVRARLPGDLESAARGGVGGARRAWFRADRAEGDLTARLEPRDVPGEVHAGGGRRGARMAVQRGQR